MVSIEDRLWAQCCTHLLSELSMKRSSSSQKCSGIPSDSISAKLSPSTWPTQGCVTDLLVSAEHGKHTLSCTNIHPHQPYPGLQIHYLRLLWKISLRLTPRSFVFVFQLCDAFCILWASHSTRSDGKTSAVLAICWWRQQKLYFSHTFGHAQN